MFASYLYTYVTTIIMKRLNLLSGIIMLLLLCNNIKAQTFSGTVLNENRQPVEFANVIMLALPDSTLAGGTSSAENGSFSFDVNKSTKNYLLRISMLGYEAITKTVESNERNLGDLIMKAYSLQLQEVVVVAQQPKIKFENGKFIANIQNSMAARGNTVESLLSQLPGVWASSGGISISGKGATVYINNRQVKFQGETLMKYLQTLRSEDIAEIEIIPNPTAEFSAEGAGGIIRIVTKRTIDEGLSGTVSATTLYQRYLGVMPYGSLQYNKGKFGAWLSLNGEKSKWRSPTKQNYQDFMNDVNYNICGTDTISDKNYSTSATLNYDFNHFNRLVFYASYMYWGKDEHIEQTTDLSGKLPDDIVTTENYKRTEQDMYSYSFSVNYDLLLDSLGKHRFTLLADYVNQYEYDTKDLSYYVNRDNNGSLISGENILNEQQKPYQIYSAELRYKHSFGKLGSGLTGLKYSYSTVKNDLSNYEKTAGAWSLNPDVGYNYQYSEKMTSGFYQYNLSKGKWSLTTAVRGEYTDGKVDGIGEAKRQFDLFPSIYYSYNLNKHHNLGLTFTRRIQRISYFTLLPQRYYSSRYTVIEGNPDLKPNKLNNISLYYNFNSTYYFSASYSFSNNALSRYTKTELIDNRSTLVYTYIDGVKEKNFNLNVYVPVKFTNWWNSINQANMYLSDYKTLNDDFSNFKYDIFTQHNFNLPSSINAQILYRYISKSKGAYTVSYPNHLLNISLQKAFLKNKQLNVKLEANRLILAKTRMETKTEQALIQYCSYGKRPLFQATLSYSFSKGKSKQIKSIQNSNSQEKGRAY